MTMHKEKDTASRRIYSLYKDVTPGAVQSNFRSDKPFPMYFSGGRGPYVTDVDGRRYIDLISGYGSLILGHRDRDVNNSVREALQAGLVSGYETDLSYEVAFQISKMVPSAKRVRFANSGTEAVMHALQMVRAFTNRQKVLKFEGCYHGWYDTVAFNHNPPLNSPSGNGCEVVPDFYGLFPHASENILISRFNDAESAGDIIKRFRNEMAAVIVEPVAFNMGCVPPSPDFLHVLREETQRYDIPLIFDEIITGFRISPGGAQKYFKVTPDISLFGKAIANGYPLSAVVGREDIMDVSSPGGRTAYAGTYNGNQISLAAARATLSKIKSGRVQDYFFRETRRMGESVSRFAEELKISARFQGIGGQFQIYFTREEVKDYNSAASSDRKQYMLFREKLRNEHVLLHPSYLFHHGITYAHSEDVVERLLSKFRTAMAGVKN
jgi:glutamate-1-semialdehyde 2,1-aminomutase